MSSFKRKSSSRQASLQPGTRQSPSSSSTIITSTGIPSLDDILGGGLPLSCSSLILAPDLHSAYGELVQKYFIAQGLACGQNVCVIDDDAEDLVKECMWIPGVTTSTTASNNAVDGEEAGEASQQHDDKIKIAWRYEQMKQFQTTVPASTPATEQFCHTLDLTHRIPQSIIDASFHSGRSSYEVVNLPGCEERSTTRIIRRIAEILNPEEAHPSPVPLRISIPSLGAPQWGDLTSQDILCFLYSLRALLRQHPHACAFLCLAPHLSTDAWGGVGWIQKLGWLSDAALTLSAFTANPSLSATFPSHHGLLHIHTLPSPHTILPPSDKFSMLRGLSSSAASAGGSGENNLAFKCMRKRLIFETLHLDLEGGVGERRTTPSTNASSLGAGTPHVLGPDVREGQPTPGTSFATMEVQLEGGDTAVTQIDSEAMDATNVKPKKPKKKVAFRSDRPELYDF